MKKKKNQHSSISATLTKALRVVAALQDSSNPGVTINELAEIAMCGKRSVWRYIKAIEAAGLKIDYTKGERHNDPWRYWIDTDVEGRIPWEKVS